ncbi:MAG: hypothetical protein ABI411_03500 [Tahibacter sp.]
MKTIFRACVPLICLLALASCGNKSALVKPGDAKPPAKSSAVDKAPTTP